MKTFIRFAVLACVMAATIFSSCKKDKKNPKVDDPEQPHHEEELITTLKFIITDSLNNSKTYTFSDPDGPGGNPAFYGPGSDPANSDQSDSVIVLKANAIYQGRIILLNESTSPAENISDEVKEEGDEHMFFYTSAVYQVVKSQPYTVLLNDSGIEIAHTDLDDGNPPQSIGLETTIKTTAASAKQPLQITLKHQPGSKNGDITTGETDIEVAFKVLVQ